MDKYMVMSKNTPESGWDMKYFESEEQAFSFYGQLDVYTKEIYVRTREGYDGLDSYTKDVPVTVNLSFTTAEVNQLRTAITHVILDFKQELRDPEITASRREVAEKSLESWEQLKRTLVDQIAK